MIEYGRGYFFTFFLSRKWSFITTTTATTNHDKTGLVKLTKRFLSY